MPRTAVLVLNHNGRDHLAACLGSLGAMDVFRPGRPGTPADPHTVDQVWLIDNASGDGSVAATTARFPWVKLIENESNMGFSAAYNRAVEACDAEWVALLNNDMRVDTTWLAALHRAAERHPEASMVAGRILSWDGRLIDFEDADTFFFGHALQRRAGHPVEEGQPEERRLLFGCAGALLVRRRTFLDVGGFDPDYFSFAEDVDLGWRAATLGHQTWLAPDAVAFHKLHGSWSRQPAVQVRALVERNALCNVLKNYADERAGVLLLAATVLTFLRSWAWTATLAEADRPRLTSDGVAHLVALRDLAAFGPVMQARRRLVQDARVVNDDALLPLFGAFTDPPLPACGRYRELFSTVSEALGIESVQALPSWSPDENRAAMDSALLLASRCGEVLEGWSASRRFTDEAPNPRWEYVLSPARALALGELRGRCFDLVDGGLSSRALAGFRRALEGSTHKGTGTEPLAAPTISEFFQGHQLSPLEPTVSVVIRTQNRPGPLARAVASATIQTRPPLEIVIVNDGGQDPSEVVRETRGEVPIRIINHAVPAGRARAAQAGLNAARGALVTFLDDDDELRPRHLEALVEPMLRYGATVTYGDVECVIKEADPDGVETILERTILGGELDPGRLFFENTVPLMAVLMDRSLAQAAGGFDSEMDYFEDWDLLLRLARTTTFRHVGEVVATYNARPGGGLQGAHRYPYLARIVDRHKDRLKGADWARFHQVQLEPLRLQARALAAQLATAEGRLAESEARWAAVQRSRYWLLYQWLRRLLGRS